MSEPLADRGKVHSGLEQRDRLVPSQESDSTRWLFEEPYRRRTIEPFPVADAFAKDRPNERERPVCSCIAASFRSLRFGDLIDQTPIDIIEFPIGQITLEPTQLALVVVLTGASSVRIRRSSLPTAL
jgi:hypothetical protein